MLVVFSNNIKKVVKAGAAQRKLFAKTCATLLLSAANLSRGAALSWLQTCLKAGLKYFLEPTLNPSFIRLAICHACLFIMEREGIKLNNDAKKMVNFVFNTSNPVVKVELNAKNTDNTPFQRKGPARFTPNAKLIIKPIPDSTIRANGPFSAGLCVNNCHTYVKTDRTALYIIVAPCFTPNAKLVIKPIPELIPAFRIWPSIKPILCPRFVNSCNEAILCVTGVAKR